MLRRVRFVDLRRTAGRLLRVCGAFLVTHVHPRPSTIDVHLVRSSHQKLHSHTTQSVTVMSRPHLEEVWGAPTRAHEREAGRGGFIVLALSRRRVLT